MFRKKIIEGTIENYRPYLLLELEKTLNKNIKNILPTKYHKRLGPVSGYEGTLLST